MDGFIEQLNLLKRMFAEIPEENVSEAMDLIDQTVEEMAQSVVLVPTTQVVCLADQGRSIVQHFLEGTSTDPIYEMTMGVDFQDLPEGDQFMEEREMTVEKREIYCFTCGSQFNNRKALFRHGKKTGHNTRDKYIRKPVRKIEVEPGMVEKGSQALPQETNEEESELYPIFEPVPGPEPEPEPEQQLQPAELPSDALADIVQSEHWKDPVKLALTCFECRSMFKNRKALYRHGKRTNHILRTSRAKQTRGGPIACSKCPYTTANEANMRRHMQRYHDNT